MSMELRKFVAPEFIFGADARKLAGQYAINIGTEKAIIVTDSTISKYDWYKDIIKSIDETDLDYIIYDEVTINPKDYECHHGAVLYQEHDCNTIIAIGGGSVIDCAKGIGILVSNGGIISDYEGVDQISYSMPPLLCIPTTSGSAADVSQFAIITNTEKNYKMAHASKMIVPDISLIDPVVTLTKSFDVTVDTGIDALSHAIEAYVSNASSSITNIHALNAIENIVRTLPLLAKDLNNLNHRSVMMEGCLNAGLAFSNASLGLIHAMAHAIGGRYNLVHGELNGMLLEHVVAYNYESAQKQYQKIESIFKRHFDSDSEKLPKLIHEFVQSIRPNDDLKNKGLNTDELFDLSGYVLHDPCIVTNPKEVTREDVVMLYEKIF